MVEYKYGVYRKKLALIESKNDQLAIIELDGKKVPKPIIIAEDDPRIKRWLREDESMEDIEMAFEDIL